MLLIWLELDRYSWTLDQDSFIFGCVRFQMKHYFREEEHVQINLIDVNVKLHKNGCLRAVKYTTCYKKIDIYKSSLDEPLPLKSFSLTYNN